MQIILTHEQADFDAIGALLGAALLNENDIAVQPRRMNRNVRAFINIYSSELPFIDSRDLPQGPIDGITLVDTQSMVTLKGVGNLTRVHVIDHHTVRADFPADWSIHTDRVGSCTTLFVEDLREHNGALSTIQATLLALGIYEDTGSLTYANTTPRDVRAAAFLLEQGASLRILSEYLNGPLSTEQRQLYDLLVGTTETHHINGQNVVIAAAAAPTMTEEISSVAHKIRDLLDPDALFMLVSSSEGVRMVARSTTDQIDVSAVAGQFGGRGHERAAAALIRSKGEPDQGLSPLECVKRDLLAMLPRFVRPSVIVGQIMSRRPMLLSPETSAQDAAILMQRYGYEGYPVVDNGRVIGLLTRRAVDRAISHHLNLTAASLMEAGEVTVSPRDPLDQLQRVMAETGWGQVPVVDPTSGEVIGIVTRTDLLKTLGTGAALLPGKQNLAERLEAALSQARLAFLKLIAAQAYELRKPVYIVGGFVRDLILERPSFDFDVVVEGNAINLAKALEKNYGGHLVSHSRFGTAKWQIDDVRAELIRYLPGDGHFDAADLPESLDLISARTEFYEYPTALPTVERSSIKLDLHRRDFTINTLALRLDGRHYGDLYDYWGGMNDLRRGSVRVLHSLSFVDDPTRMLRAVRFEQRFHFRIEERTLELIAEATDLLRQVSADRLRHELDLMLSEENAAAMLARLDELGLLRAIHPDFIWKNEWRERLESALVKPLPAEWDLPDSAGHMPARRFIAYLLWLMQFPLEAGLAVANRLRFPRPMLQSIQAVSLIKQTLPALSSPRPSQVVNELDGVSPLALYALRLDGLAPNLEILLEQYIHRWRKIHPFTGGEDLNRLGLVPGPAYRQILTQLRNAWLDGEISSPEAEQLWLSAMMKEIDPYA
ncbi:tRNA nucleotidyltransferase/poly(A) polymerase [Longilinea arvoryzae]|uniref:tRNA nucleotidyltransferase/poly(A) polymerase n=1 Tax=Longilinea arvoryzae TaxID=360412 RepID=A0A0S7BI36_9CHLR|nr:CBS domain-containing protein [Longilinea arvoryzae]GAP15257.1 tRNA nucleotidyltransferase/poly(A) polymerase [Longilinea arvoryzae]